MCKFFSFISKGDGQFLYFDAKHRQGTNGYDSDSYFSLVRHYLEATIADDKVNKYEYNNGQFVIRQINVKDDSKQADEWIKKFVKTKEFEEIQANGISRNGHKIRYVTKQVYTKEVLLAALQYKHCVIKYVNI